MQLKIFLLQTYSGLENEDLILAFLRKSYSCQVVSNISHANIVIRGVFPRPTNYTLFRRAMNKLSKKIKLEHTITSKIKIRDIVDPGKSQLWIHLSGESPNLNPCSSFYNSECDIGIGHESIIDINYTRMPHWYQSIDWSGSGVPREPKAFYRLGKPVTINELTTGIPASRLSDYKNKCALINSHLSSPRDVFSRQIKSTMPFDIYGTPGTKTNQDKRDILKNYNFSLVPENTLYPGYVTEKIPEAFACGTFSIGWYLPGVENDFTTDSHLNLVTLGPDAFCEKKHILHQKLEEVKIRMKLEGLPPLLNEMPSLDAAISLVERGISSI